MGEAKRRRHGLGDAPIEPKFREKMNVLAHFLDKQFNGDAPRGERQVGFCLLVFNFGDEGRCNYISNADRLDMIVLLKEQLARFEGQPEIEGHA
jgi:hypothetical protein